MPDEPTHAGDLDPDEPIEVLAGEVPKDTELVDNPLAEASVESGMGATTAESYENAPSGSRDTDPVPDADDAPDGEERDHTDES